MNHNLDDLFKRKMNKLEDLKIGLRFANKNRFKFNSILENGLGKLNKIANINHKDTYKKKTKKLQDFNLWMFQLDEYIKIASCHIYSIKKIRSIEKAENWLLFKPSLFSCISLNKFFKILLFSHKESFHQKKKDVNYLRKYSNNCKILNFKMVECDEDVEINTSDSSDQDHINNDEKKSFEERIKEEKQNMIKKKEMKLTKIKIHLQNENKNHFIYETLIRNIEKELLEYNTMFSQSNTKMMSFNFFNFFIKTKHHNSDNSHSRKSKSIIDKILQLIFFASLAEETYIT